MPDQTIAFEISDRVDTNDIDHLPLFETVAEEIALALDSTGAKCVASYRMENNSDDSIGSNDGSDVGSVTYSSGTKKVGSYSMSLPDGSGSYSDLPALGMGRAYGEKFTIEGWINTDQVGAQGTIAGNSSGSGGDTDKHYVLFRINASGKVELIVGAAQATDRSVVGTTILSPGTFYHVLAYYDGAGEVLIELNRTPEGTPSGTVASGTSTDDWVIGAKSGAIKGNNVWDGFIDQLSFYDDELTTAEKDARYASGAGSILAVYPSSSPSPAQVWNAMPVGTIVKPSTAHLIVYKDDVAQTYASTDLLLKHAKNGGGLSSSITQAAYRALGDITITDATESIKLVPVFISDGIYKTGCRAVLYMDVTLPEGGGAESKLDKFTFYGNRRLF